MKLMKNKMLVPEGLQEILGQFCEREEQDVEE